MIPRPAALGLLLTLALAAPGCGPRQKAAHDELAGSPATGSDTLAVQPSMFELTFPFTDADGRTRHLEELRGQPFVASMVYTHCTSLCPRIIADLQRLERSLPDDVRARTRFVLFSLDPERDTPAALHAFAQEHGLDPARWTLLVSSPDDMRTLAAVIDVRFRPDTGGEIAHSAVIVVAGPDGVIRHRQNGLDGDPASLVAAVSGAK
jgi:protein SCO1/2